jgi:DNA-binding IclR family transcriptional regulator
MDDAECWTLVCQVGLDCIPDVRRRVLRWLSDKDAPKETSDIADAVAYPTGTTRRVLEDLTGHKLVRRFADSKAHQWEMSRLSIDLLARAQVKL